MLFSIYPVEPLALKSNFNEAFPETKLIVSTARFVAFAVAAQVPFVVNELESLSVTPARSPIPAARRVRIVELSSIDNAPGSFHL